MPAATARSAIASAPGTARNDPSSASSPASATSARASVLSCSVAARIAAAIARSKPGPALRRSAGARFAVIRRCGYSKPELIERGADPLARLAHGRVGQPHQRKRRQPLAHVDLDPDLASLDADQREGAGGGEHGPNLGATGARVARACANCAPKVAHRGGVTEPTRLRGRPGAITAPRARGRGLRSVAMTVARQRLGREAEDLVAARLAGAGWTIVERNARPAGVRGELDLIALDRDALVFVEVKARSAGSRAGPETPAMAVGPRKRAKLRGLAAAWLRERGYDVPRHRDAALRRRRPAPRRQRPHGRVRAPARGVLSQRRRGVRACSVCRPASAPRVGTPAHSRGRPDVHALGTAPPPARPRYSARLSWLYAIDANERRCSDDGPCSTIAARCSGVE